MTMPFRETMTYNDFQEQFPFTCKVKDFKRIARNTFKYTIDNVTKVRLCETDIVIYKDNSMILNTGGFYNNLTKNRLNELIPGWIFQSKGIWYYADTHSTTSRFFDGIEVDINTGMVLNKNAAPQYNNIDEKNKEINKLINKYCKAVSKLDELPDEEAGDCSFCNRWTYTIDDTDHLLSHLKEVYIMKSLILNALSDKGYTNPSFIYHIERTDKKKSLITRALRNYFRKHLIRKS